MTTEAELNNRIPAKKIMRWIDNRISNATLVGDLNLLTDFKEMIMAYDKDEDLKRALSEMGVKSMSDSLKRDREGANKKIKNK